MAGRRASIARSLARSCLIKWTVARVFASSRIILSTTTGFSRTLSPFPPYLVPSILLARLFIRPNHREAQHLLADQPEDLRDINNLTLSCLKRVARYKRDEREKRERERGEERQRDERVWRWTMGMSVKGLKGKISAEERKDYHPNRIHLPGSARRWVIHGGGHLAKITRLGHLPIKVRVSKGILRRDPRVHPLQSNQAMSYMRSSR